MIVRPFMGAPVVLAGFEDDFTDTNGILLSAHDPSPGPTSWGPWSVAVSEGSVRINSNRARLASTVSNDEPTAQCILSGSTTEGLADDFEIELTLVARSAFLTNLLTLGNGIVFNYVDTNNYWVARSVGGSFPGSTLELVSREAGVETVRDTAADNFGVGETMKVQRTGGTRKVFIDDVEILSSSYSAHDTAKGCGFRMDPAGVHLIAAITIDFDDFVVTPL